MEFLQIKYGSRNFSYNFWSNYVISLDMIRSVQDVQEDFEKINLILVDK